MAMNWRKASLFGVGLALGIGAGVLGAVMYRDARVLNVSTSTRILGAPAAPAAPAAPDAAAAAKAANQCENAPLIPAAGERDGQLSLQGQPGAGSEDEVSSLILGGKEAAAAGRKRDAEVAFMNACRNAVLLGADDPLPLADAEYQLARHYANVAAFGAPRARELFERAERLYSASYLTYAARLGVQHEKTRFAQEGLKTVQQVTGRYGPIAPVGKAPPVAPAPQAAASEIAAPQAAASAPALPQAAASAPAATLGGPAAATPPVHATDTEPVRQQAKAPAEPTKARPRTPKAAEASDAPPRELATAPPVREPSRRARPRSEPRTERPAADTIAPEPLEESAPPVVRAEPRARIEPRRVPRTEPVESAPPSEPPPPPVRSALPEPPPEPLASPGTASGSVNEATPAPPAEDTGSTP